MLVPTWTKDDQEVLDELQRRRVAHTDWLNRGVADLVERLHIDQYDMVEKLIKNRKAFIEVLERFDDEGETQ